MLFSSLDTINMKINPDRHQSIHSFVKPPKVYHTSEQQIFVVTNYLKSTVDALDKFSNSLNNAFGIKFRQLKFRLHE